MRLLLDTHAWLYCVDQPERLSDSVQAVLRDDAAQVFLSPISVWEVLVLARRGRIVLEPDPQSWVATALRLGKAAMAPLTHAIAMRSEDLGGFESADPADRFLVATAIVEGMTLVTADRAMRRYRELDSLW